MVRNYKLRSYVICDLCDHRYCGELQKGLVYYRCTPNPKNHSHLPWFTQHPKAAMIREDLLADPLEKFLRQRVFGTKRTTLLTKSNEDGETARILSERSNKLAGEITELQRRQSNLLNELECFEPTGDSDVDSALRGGIKDRFATIVNDIKNKKAQLASVDDELSSVAPADDQIFEEIPTVDFKLDLLAEDQQRRLFDALHLEMIYNANLRDLHIRVTVAGATAAELGSTIKEILATSANVDPVRLAKREEDFVLHGAPLAAHFYVVELHK